VDVLLAARRWAETWRRAWPDKESQRIAALYAKGASYRSSPFDQPEVGGALAYVERQFAAKRRWNVSLPIPSRRVIELRPNGGQVSSRPARC
jgi:hypothetical protein